MVTKNNAARFWSKVAVKDAGECWPWTAGLNPDGYGRICVGGVRMPSSHAALYIDGRPRPAGMNALHSCDNPPCCNPAHLRWGTQSENVDDRQKRGRGQWARGEKHGRHTKPERTPRGEKHGNAKLTERDILEIRAAPLYVGARLDLALHYGVSAGLISQIITRRAWAHI